MEWHKIQTACQFAETLIFLSEQGKISWVRTRGEKAVVCQTEVRSASVTIERQVDGGCVDYRLAISDGGGEVFSMVADVRGYSWKRFEALFNVADKCGQNTMKDLHEFIEVLRGRSWKEQPCGQS